MEIESEASSIFAPLPPDSPTLMRDRDKEVRERLSVAAQALDAWREEQQRQIEQRRKEYEARVAAWQERQRREAERQREEAQRQRKIEAEAERIRQSHLKRERREREERENEQLLQIARWQARYDRTRAKLPLNWAGWYIVLRDGAAYECAGFLEVNSRVAVKYYDPGPPPAHRFVQPGSIRKWVKR